MEKNLGKITIWFSCMNRSVIVSIFLLMASNFIFASESSIVLRMQDMNHKPIDQAMCKAPFILQVELKNLDGYTDAHVIQHTSGIDNFKVSRSMTSHNTSNDNGKKTSKVFYNFVLRADKKGKFSVGHLTLKDKTGNSIVSNRLVIPVGDEVVLSESSQKDRYFMTMNVHKKEAYVGEKITLYIKFYDRIFVDNLHLQFPDFQNLYLVKSKNNVHQSTTVIDEQEYYVTEWTFDLYATEPGSLILQDIHAVFFAPELENKFKFGGAFDFFRSLHKTEQYISAQPIKMEILPLPQHADFSDVSAVGQFSKFTISINQNTVPVGQGVVVTTELFGHGNLEIMDPTPLILPNDFRYYDSNTIKIDEKRSYKHSEFIVQANTAGTYHIEPQTFVYFDPVAMQYKKLYSNALDITITPVKQAPQSSHAADILLDDVAEENESKQNELKDFSIIQKGAVHNQSLPMIPLKIYQQFLWLLFWIWLFLIIYEFVLQKYLFKHRSWTKFIIFLRAKKACQVARSHQEIRQLHPIFVQVFTYLTGVQAGQLYDTTMVQYLIDKGFSAEQIQAWKKFYEQILQASFSSSSQLQSHQQDLFQQSLEWIKLLKEKA